MSSGRAVGSTRWQTVGRRRWEAGGDRDGRGLRPVEEAAGERRDEQVPNRRASRGAADHSHSGRVPAKCSNVRLHPPAEAHTNTGPHQRDDQPCLLHLHLVFLSAKHLQAAQGRIKEMTRPSLLPRVILHVPPRCCLSHCGAKRPRALRGYDRALVASAAAGGAAWRAATQAGWGRSWR